MLDSDPVKICLEIVARLYSVFTEVNKITSMAVVINPCSHRGRGEVEEEVWMVVLEAAEVEVGVQEEVTRGIVRRQPNRVLVMHSLALEPEIISRNKVSILKWSLILCIQWSL